MSAGHPDTFIMDRAMREAQMTSVGDPRGGYGSYDSGPDELDLALGPGLRAVGFQSLADAKEWLEKTCRRQPNGLEIAGQGKTFATQRISAIANCLAFPECLIAQPQRTPRPRRRHANPPITFVPGDIAEQTTWDNIQTAVREDLQNPPNIILFTPAEIGLSSMPRNSGFFESVVVRSLALADPGPVVMVGEMSSHFSIRLEQRLLEMQHRGDAQVAIIAGLEYSLFALRRESGKSA